MTTGECRQLGTSADLSFVTVNAVEGYRTGGARELLNVPARELPQSEEVSPDSPQLSTRWIP
jgi:hypothetical protein